jgi:hypothetical protein
MNSDEGIFYMKIVDFDEIYNFVVESFCYLNSSSYSNNRYTIQIWRLQTEIWIVY